MAFGEEDIDILAGTGASDYRYNKLGFMLACPNYLDTPNPTLIYSNWGLQGYTLCFLKQRLWVIVRTNKYP